MMSSKNANIKLEYKDRMKPARSKQSGWHPVMPPNFLCPLTMEVMHEPVMDHDGHNFEKAAILEWVQQEETSICPISHKPLEQSDLVPNDTLRETIQRWMEQHGYSPLTMKLNTIDEEEQTQTTNCSTQTPHSLDEKMELGEAIASLSMVLASNEGYIEIGHQEESGEDDQEQLDCSAYSGFYSMFLPQEREAMARMQRRVRERQEAERLARIYKAGVGISAVAVSLVLILYLTKLARMYLLAD